MLLNFSRSIFFLNSYSIRKKKKYINTNETFQKILYKKYKKRSILKDKKSVDKD